MTTKGRKRLPRLVREELIGVATRYLAQKGVGLHYSDKTPVIASFFEEGVFLDGIASAGSIIANAVDWTVKAAATRRGLRLPLQ